ncbi:MAG: acyl carrier protein [Planctomycetes bacterium]|nr:acyl carrier protein [Planctomycetota bacterium]
MPNGGPVERSAPGWSWLDLCRPCAQPSCTTVAAMNESQQRLAQHLISGLNLEDITPADIDPQAPLFGEGLGLDSIDALELAVIVERQYGVRIPNMEVGKQAFASVAALDSFIRAQPPTAANAS